MGERGGALHEANVLTKIVTIIKYVKVPTEIGSNTRTSNIRFCSTALCDSLQNKRVKQKDGIV